MGKKTLAVANLKAGTVKADTGEIRPIQDVTSIASLIKLLESVAPGVGLRSLAVVFEEGSTAAEVSVDFSCDLKEVDKQLAGKRKITLADLIHLLEKGELEVGTAKLSLDTQGPYKHSVATPTPLGSIDEDTVRAAIDALTNDVPNQYLKGFQLTSNPRPLIPGTRTTCPVPGSSAWLATIMSNMDRIPVSTEGGLTMLGDLPQGQATERIVGWLQERRTPAWQGFAELDPEHRALVRMVETDESPVDALFPGDEGYDERIARAIEEEQCDHEWQTQVDGLVCVKCGGLDPEERARNMGWQST
jgi:hypothetical protein